MKEFYYPINPFTQEYYNQEKDWFVSRCKQIKNKRVSIEYKTLCGEMDGFLYHGNFYIEEVPVFKIDGEVWMSITPMEIESHYIPIENAMGRVGVAGLGLGYYVQRILEKESVDEVVVYELSQDVIDLYLENFGTHPKLTIVHGDVFEKCKNEHFHWFYNDIYLYRFEDQAFDDMATLIGDNLIEDYHFWTLEGYVLSAIQKGKIANRIVPFVWRSRYYPFIQALFEEKKDSVLDYLDSDESIELIEKFTNTVKEWGIGV
jgi:hypothetical protein